MLSDLAIWFCILVASLLKQLSPVRLFALIGNLVELRFYAIILPIKKNCRMIKNTQKCRFAFFLTEI